ncbi:MAG: four helix bundle protein [Candidatus Bipolaricaulota bacterium]|nr:four helix bundle protein [Candidatus Bipolaricaulota bacterium]
MPKIERFEDIQAWQKARELVQAIYAATKQAPFSKDFGLRDQIRRAGVSIMLNIAEGFARRTDREFAQFLVQAHGSAAEIQAALYVALDQGYITQEQFRNLYEQAGAISKMLLTFTQYLLKPSASDAPQTLRTLKTLQTLKTSSRGGQE